MYNFMTAKMIREAIIALRDKGVPESKIVVNITLDELMGLVDPEKRWATDWEWDEKEERWYCPNCRYMLLPHAGTSVYCPSCGAYMNKTRRQLLNTQVLLDSSL